MPIERNFSADLRPGTLCNYLREGGGSYNNIGLKAEPRREQGYVLADNPVRAVSAPEALSLPVFIRRRVEVRSPAGRLLFEPWLTDVVVFECELTVLAILFLKQGLDPAKAALVETAFANTDIEGTSPDEAERDLFAQGVDIDDYQVDLAFGLQSPGRPPFPRTAVEAYLAQVNGITLKGRSLYVARETGEQEISCEGGMPQYPPEAVIIVESEPEEIVPVLTERAQQELDRRDCDNIEVTEYRVGTAFQYPEFKVDWLQKRVKIGRCWTYVPWPVTMTRTRKNILYAYVVSTPQMKQAFERAIRDCVEFAAISTGVLLILTSVAGGWAAALTAFVTACQQCLETKFEDTVRCLYPDLKLIEEYDDWH